MATAAEPILASALWNPKSAVRQSPAALSATNLRLSTACHTIDDALNPGIEYGTLTCLSGDSDTGVEKIYQALLVSHLLTSPTAAATVIDTGLSLDVRKLHNALSTRLSVESDGDDNATKEQRAARMLDRVKIMKVFDFEGLTECLAEVRDDDLEGKPLLSDGESEGFETKKKAPRGTIGDSEDEDENEIIDSPSHSPPQPPSPAVPTSAQQLPKQKADANPRPSLLIITDITQPLNRHLKTNYANAQALLSAFMRSLAHLTKLHRICTVLTNGVNTSNRNGKEESTSIFSSCTVQQPALGRAFPYMLDLHVLVHRMHVEKQGGGSARDGESCSIIEILHDRYGSRAGKWGAFTVDDCTGELQGIST